jgi:hypothetical protein
MPVGSALQRRIYKIAEVYWTGMDRSKPHTE